MLTRTVLENALILTGESFWIFSALAQLRKLHRTHNPHGLSALSHTLNASANVAWMVYFVSRQLWFPVGTNLTLLLIELPIIAYILSDRAKFKRGLLSIIVLGPLTGYTLLTFPEAAGWIGMTYNWIASTPWLVKVVTTRKVSGISGHSLWFTAGALTCVLSYAILVKASPLIAVCIQGLIYEAIIVRYYLRYRRG